MKKLILLGLSMIVMQFIGAQQSFYLLTGTYTTGKSEGIYVYKFNIKTGMLDFISKAPAINPSFLAISNDKKFVYAVNEDGTTDGSAVVAFAFDAKLGELNKINEVPAMGAAPCYISTDKQGKWVYTANYLGGNIAAFPIDSDGSLKTATQVVTHQGKGINAQRQEAPHVHTAYFSPDGQSLLTADLGNDSLHCYNIDAQKEAPLSEQFAVGVQKGNGPRHMVFHPNKQWLYVINELAGTIDLFRYQPHGIVKLQTISTDETNNTDKGCADIHVSADGKYLYATNRGKYNTISTFAINNQNGQLQLLKVQSTGGIMPRNFVIDPTGNYVLIGHQKSDEIVVFKRNQQTGLLTQTGYRVGVGSPVCLLMIPVND